jgi:hypothetical protein
LGRPRLTAVTAAALLAAIFALRVAVPDLSDVALLLFTLPIALVAVAFGLRGGLACAAVAEVLVIVAFRLVDHQPTSVGGWIGRLLPLLLLGFVLGDAMDRLRAAEADRSRLVHNARRHEDAVQLNDTIVQSLSAAKWALEAGDLDGGLEIVTQTLHQSNRLVSDLIRGADLRPLWMGTSTSTVASDPVPAPEPHPSTHGFLMGDARGKIGENPA